MIFVKRMCFLRSRSRFEEVLIVLLYLVVLSKPCLSKSNNQTVRAITVRLLEPVVFQADQRIIRIEMVPSGCLKNDTKSVDMSKLGFNSLDPDDSKEKFYELTLMPDKRVSIQGIAIADDAKQSIVKKNHELLFVMFEGETVPPFCDLTKVHMEFYGVYYLSYKGDFNSDSMAGAPEGAIPLTTSPTGSLIEVYTPTSTRSTFLRNDTASGRTPTTIYPPFLANSSVGVDTSTPTRSPFPTNLTIDVHTTTTIYPPFLTNSSVGVDTSTPTRSPFPTNSTIDVHTPTTTYSPFPTNSTQDNTSTSTYSPFPTNSTTKDNTSTPTHTPDTTHPTIIAYTPTPKPYPTEEYTNPPIRYTTTTRKPLFPPDSTLSQGAYLIGIIVTASIVGCLAYVGFLKFHKPRQHENIANGGAFSGETELQVYPISLVNNHARSESPSGRPPSGNRSPTAPPVDHDPPPPYEELLDSGPPPPAYFDVSDYSGLRSGKGYYR